jgi:outer membrane biogenesis lipoprotein LolB
MDKVIFTLFVIIILCFFNCARQVVKKPISKDFLLKNINTWQDQVTEKSGTGEMTVSEPDKRFSSYFSFKYNVNGKILSGELLGSFGMSIGTFYFSRDSISIRDKDGKEVKKEVLSLFEENPDASLPEFLVWDIPISTNPETIPIDNGWLLSDNDLEIFIREDLKPTRVVLHRDNKIIIKYSDFRSQEGISCPFKIEAKTEKKSLEIEFRKIDFE